MENVIENAVANLLVIFLFIVCNLPFYNLFCWVIRFVFEIARHDQCPPYHTDFSHQLPESIMKINAILYVYSNMCLGVSYWVSRSLFAPPLSTNYEFLQLNIGKNKLVSLSLSLRLCLSLWQFGADFRSGSIVPMALHPSTCGAHSMHLLTS